MTPAARYIVAKLVPPTKKATERAKIVRVERRKRVLGRIGEGLGVLITLFGIYTGWITIKTRISMSSDSPVNPSDIMSAPSLSRTMGRSTYTT